MWEQHLGEIVELPREEAKNLIRLRQAEAITREAENEINAALAGSPAGAVFPTLKKT